MASEKLVDGNFLGKLLANSYEVSMGAVEEAVIEQASLFGVADDTRLRVLGTYPDHAIVATETGDFYRCEWSIKDGVVQLSNIRQIDVPVYEGEVRASTIRNKYDAAVTDILECRSEDAEVKLKELLDLAVGGVPMTAEAIEHLFLENRSRFQESDWAQMVGDREQDIRRFLGAEALRLSFPKAKFESLTGEAIDESAAEARRSDVVSALGQLADFLGTLRTKTALARQVNEGYLARDGSEDGALATADFVQFTSGFAEDLDGMISIVEDAMAVSEDGCAKCLARLHDGIAGQMREWALAAAFAEKLARKFEAPPKAA